MRTVTVEICGETIDMPVSFAAGCALADAGCDPLVVAMQSGRGSSLTSVDVAKIIHVGAKQAGSKLTLEQIGEEVFRSGILPYLKPATEYIAAFVTASPEHPVKGEDGAA